MLEDMNYFITCLKFNGRPVSRLHYVVNVKIIITAINSVEDHREKSPNIHTEQQIPKTYRISE